MKLEETVRDTYEFTGKFKVVIGSNDVTNNLGDALKTLSGLRILLKESNLLEDITIELDAKKYIQDGIDFELS